jgi:hypothetical protein
MTTNPPMNSIQDSGYVVQPCLRSEAIRDG